MIILPDKHIPRSRFLMPVAASEWRSPSQRSDTYGIENQTRFRITARLHDGHAIWRGWFDDRDDADAFMFAAILGTLNHQPALWRLPTPHWNPDIGIEPILEIAVQVFITSSPGSNQTYTSPSDWNNSNNTVETLGGGGGGAASGTAGGAARGSGGGGGAWNKITNFSFATPGTTTATVRVGAGGTAATAGGDTWFNNTALAGSSVGSKGGSGGSAGAGSATSNGGAGGVGSSGVGTSSNNGGRGGNATASGAECATGGGGAAGPNGAGNQGVDGTNTQTNGGSGDAGSGGSGGTSATNATAGAGGNGTEWNASNGSGGGGGGATGSGPTGGAGGNYGGGGGGATNSGAASTAGQGKQGIIVLTYTPGTSSVWNNLAMLGM